MSTRREFLRDLVALVAAPVAARFVPSPVQAGSAGSYVSYLIQDEAGVKIETLNVDSLVKAKQILETNAIEPLNGKLVVFAHPSKLKTFREWFEPACDVKLYEPLEE